MNKSVKTAILEALEKSKIELKEVQDLTTRNLTERYGTPESDTDAIYNIINSFDAMVKPSSVDDREALEEYYRIIMNRNLPAYQWIMEAIHVVSKKGDEKRNVNYIIGMLRSWLKNGFGNIPSTEQDEITAFIQETIGCHLSGDARQVLQGLLGTYGSNKIAFNTHKLKGVDYSYVMMLSLRDILSKEYA